MTKLDGTIMSQIIEHQGLLFDLIPGDTFALREAFEWNVYHLDVKCGMKFLDIGAYKGMVSLYAAKLGAYVRCFEPRPETFDVLKKNISLNHLEKSIDAHNAGVRSSEGQTRSLDNPYHTQAEVEMNGSFGNDGGCPLECVGGLEEHIKGAGGISGPIVKLVSFADALGTNRWNIVKIDCEGSEYEILTKATDEQLSQIDFLTMEIHGWLGRPKIDAIDRKSTRLNSSHP